MSEESYDLRKYSSPKEEYDLSNYAAPKKEESWIEKLPSQYQAIMKYLPFALSQRPGVTKERLGAVGQGVLERGQGIKQFGLGLGENLGLVEPGTQGSYTALSDLQRNKYQGSLPGYDPFTQLVREQTSSAPENFLLAGLIPGGSLLTKMLAGGLGGGALGATQYVPEESEKSRLGNTVKESAMGAGIPLVGAVPRAATNFLDRVVRPALYRPNIREVGGIIQRGHDALNNEAQGIFTNVANEAINSGLGQLAVPNTITSRAARFLPRTDKVRDLIRRANTGDYGSLRQLQTDIGDESYRVINNPSSSQADRNRAFEGLDFRNVINREISNNLRTFGRSDLADELQRGINMWSDMREHYYTDNVIRDMVTQRSRRIPNNIYTKLSEVSEPIERIRRRHPEINQHLELNERRDNAISVLRTLLGTGAGALGGGAITAALLNADRLRRAIQGQ